MYDRYNQEIGMNALDQAISSSNYYPKNTMNDKKANAQIGIDSEKSQIFLFGAKGNIPLDKVFVNNGSDIYGMNPIMLKGVNTYLIEWSATVKPVDEDEAVQLNLIVDGKPVPGSENFTSATKGIVGLMPISGGTILNVPEGMHTMYLEYHTGKQGILIGYANLRIVQIG